MGVAVTRAPGSATQITEPPLPPAPFDTLPPVSAPPAPPVPPVPPVLLLLCASLAAVDKLSPVLSSLLHASIAQRAESTA